MAKMGRKSGPPKSVQENVKDKPKKPPPPSRSNDDDFEDGDIATPKRDHDGDDDEPL